MSRKDVTDEQVVRAALAFHGAKRPAPFVDERLAAETGQPRKVCGAAIERAIGRGLIDCGVSARTCWPTSVGLALIEAELTSAEQDPDGGAGS